MWWASVASVPGIPDNWRDTALGKIGGVDDHDPADAMAAMITQGMQHFSAALPTVSPLDDDELGALTMPTYVDSLAGGKNAAARAGALTNAVVAVFPDTTHSLPMQAKDRLASELPVFWREAERG